ncbi:3-oxoacyl-ACP synthase [Tenacibaculum larymnensis]|uniref:GreA/GreB family elongation factor n=1 Tax=Tenacibaculum larymnensis TaxID=2878201 RepID=A0A9X4EK07_9FLAO|nr:3-oxoacyl-ACP synthase [Tenacibaculum larymnensis]MDE1205446.1 GreA/GreB family elongation factor [Tenacibaculum larymnensis]
MGKINIKEELYKQCELYVNKRLQTVEETITSHQKALQSETKSSAGDKHETGRAMLQLEMEKASQQLSGIAQMKETLAKINTDTTSKVAHLGSVVTTTSAINYFISVSVGMLIVKEKKYFAISPSSPIGRLILGKKEGESFEFNGAKNIIKEIF